MFQGNTSSWNEGQCMPGGKSLAQAQVIRNDEICIMLDESCIENDGFCIYNDEFCI